MKTHMLIIINLLATLMCVTSCKQDVEESFFFKIEDGLQEWHVEAEGGEQEYIVEANAPWQIVHKGIVHGLKFLLAGVREREVF